MNKRNLTGRRFYQINEHGLLFLLFFGKYIYNIKKSYYMAKKYTLPIGKGFYVSKIIFITPILYRCCFQDYNGPSKVF